MERLHSFIHACTFGRKDVVELFLSYPNIELNARSTDGTTAFMSACNNGHKDVVKLLLNHSGNNIDLDAKRNNEMTAFMMALSRGHKDVIQLILNHGQKTFNRLIGACIVLALIAVILQMYGLINYCDLAFIVIIAVIIRSNHLINYCLYLYRK